MVLQGMRECFVLDDDGSRYVLPAAMASQAGRRVTVLTDPSNNTAAPIP